MNKPITKDQYIQGVRKADERSELIKRLPGGKAANTFLHYKQIAEQRARQEALKNQNGNGGVKKPVQQQQGLFSKKINAEQINDNYLKQKGIAAHELKHDYLGAKDKVSNYDLYVNKDTDEILIYKKGGKGVPIETGQYIK